MKKIKFIAFVNIAFLLGSCGNNEQSQQNGSQRESLLSKIKSVENEIHNSMKLNTTVADSAIKAYSDFVTQFPDDSLSADFLFKSAEIEMATDRYAKALSSFQQITERHPDYKLATESLYLQGYIWDNFLNDEVKAKSIYEEVIKKYPESNYAVDAKAAINNLGKTDEELIKEFEEKNKK